MMRAPKDVGPNSVSFGSGLTAALFSLFCGLLAAFALWKRRGGALAAQQLGRGRRKAAAGKALAQLTGNPLLVSREKGKGAQSPSPARKLRPLSMPKPAVPALRTNPLFERQKL